LTSKRGPKRHGCAAANITRAPKLTAPQCATIQSNRKRRGDFCPGQQHCLPGSPRRFCWLAHPPDRAHTKTVSWIKIGSSFGEIFGPSDLSPARSRCMQRARGPNGMPPAGRRIYRRTGPVRGTSVFTGFTGGLRRRAIFADSSSSRGRKTCPADSSWIGVKPVGGTVCQIPETARGSDCPGGLGSRLAQAKQDHQNAVFISRPTPRAGAPEKHGTAQKRKTRSPPGWKCSIHPGDKASTSEARKLIAGPRFSHLRRSLQRMRCPCAFVMGQLSFRAKS